MSQEYVQLNPESIAEINKKIEHEYDLTFDNALQYLKTIQQQDGAIERIEHLINTYKLYHTTLKCTCGTIIHMEQSDNEYKVCIIDNENKKTSIISEMPIDERVINYIDIQLYTYKALECINQQLTLAIKTIKEDDFE